MRFQDRNLPRGSSRAGFSLIEMLIVVTIMGTLLAIGLPRIDPNRYKADAAAVTLRSLLMQAQRDAIVRQHDLIVSIDTGKARLILGYDKNDDGNIQMTERVRMQALPEGDRYMVPPTYLTEAGMNEHGAFRGNAIKTVSGYPSVVFRRDGSVSSALELYVSTKRAKASDFRVVTVVQATGRTSFQRYAGTKWVAAQ
jgi:prepilin-type N-terminal cleavage/methylation domain-containing protein